jgi:hypothetical protein
LRSNSHPFEERSKLDPARRMKACREAAPADRSASLQSIVATQHRCNSASLQHR